MSSWKDAPVLRRVFGRREETRAARAVEKVMLLSTIALAGFLYLLAGGMLAAGEEFTGTIVLLVAMGLAIDLVPEAWLYMEEFAPEHPELYKAIKIHYLLEAIAYLFLLTAFLDVLPVPVFYVYAVFLLFWLMSFLVGEVVIIILKD